MKWYHCLLFLPMVFDKHQFAGTSRGKKRAVFFSLGLQGQTMEQDIQPTWPNLRVGGLLDFFSFIPFKYCLSEVRQAFLH